MQRDIGLHASSLALAAGASVLNAFALARIGAVDAAALSALCTAAAAASWEGLRGRSPWPAADPTVLGVGLLDGVGGICLFASLARLGPVPVALVGALSPVFAAPLAFLVLGERPSGRLLMVGGGAVAGALLFSWRGPAALCALGLALAGASTLAYAAGNLLAKLALRRASASSVLAGSRVFSLAVVLAYAALAGGLGRGPRDAGGAALAALAALMGNVASVLLFYRTLGRATLSATTVVRVAGPVATAACAWPFFPVALSPMNVAGGAVLIGSVAWLGRAVGRAPRSGPAGARGASRPRRLLPAFPAVRRSS